jgi:hypothetical protein
MYRDTTNVEYEMYGYVGNNRSHGKSDERFKEKFGNHTRKIFNIFTKKDNYTWNVTHKTDSTALRNLKSD